jgi:ABC-type sugar transport system ATPase subunit
MEHVIRVCDRFVVLRLGEKVADVPKHGTTALDLVGMLTGATSVDGDRAAGSVNRSPS